MTPSPTDLARPFLPAKDFALSKSFYQTLGFATLFDGQVVIFGIGATSFILQNYFEKTWAENFMMQLVVDDLDAWWQHVSHLDLPSRFAHRNPTRRTSPAVPYAYPAV